MRAQRFANEPLLGGGRQGNQRRQRRTEIVGGEAQLANVTRQPALVVLRMTDGMRPRRQLGEHENGNEKEMAQRIHGAILTPLTGTRVRGMQQAAANAQTPIVDVRRRHAGTCGAPAVTA